MNGQDYVVGKVGFGPNFGAEAALVDALEAKVAKLIKDRDILRRALERCAALSNEVADERYEALQQTAP